MHKLALQPSLLSCQRQHWSTAAPVLLQVDQNNYPEMLGKTAIINAGAVINFVFPFVKPFLDKRTVNKIEVRASIGVQADERLYVSQMTKPDELLHDCWTMLHASASKLLHLLSALQHPLHPITFHKV